ncbi:rod shape-determining protein MreC [Helicobacter sp. MIT 21-1697]|uniref:rod shape-determining protein MreC n=1 Tax=Helicobacter sp. MIT 21-1697 TaxID=2993733 RepID=UPI00224A8CDF|nr:rod shape-determining protein MreC [Helicobacter sp. MIT 21-1697]MCX2717079.1 rod shape-determining protein MreC [Helicobacter sp. MIT 21-1697]
MRYKFLIFGIIFFICIFVLMEVDKSIQAKILSVSDYVKVFFLDSKEDIANTYNKHIDQVARIESLSAKVQDYDRLKLEIQALRDDRDKLHNLIGIGGITYATSEIHPARIISFATLGQRDRVWLNTDLSRYRQGGNLEDRIFGIVKDNVALGVAVYQNGRIEGFLNGNENCHYDVYIGENKAMGIVSGSRNGKILVDYISDWIEIHKGDKVFTSGLDGIFLENIPVGIVEDVRENYGYLSVDVKPYASVRELSYVWIIDREIPQLGIQDAQNEMLKEVPENENVEESAQVSDNEQS